MDRNEDSVQRDETLPAEGDFPPAPSVNSPQVDESANRSLDSTLDTGSGSTDDPQFAPTQEMNGSDTPGPTRLQTVPGAFV